MRADKNIYHKLASSICPTVYGHDDVKRGILLMLFGGVVRAYCGRGMLCPLTRLGFVR